jgi:hypothetical protein
MAVVGGTYVRILRRALFRAALLAAAAVVGVLGSDPFTKPSDMHGGSFPSDIELLVELSAVALFFVLGGSSLACIFRMPASCRQGKQAGS